MWVVSYVGIHFRFIGWFVAELLSYTSPSLRLFILFSKVKVHTVLLY